MVAEIIIELLRSYLGFKKYAPSVIKSILSIYYTHTAKPTRLANAMAAKQQSHQCYDSLQISPAGHPPATNYKHNITMTNYYDEKLQGIIDDGLQTDY